MWSVYILHDDPPVDHTRSTDQDDDEKGQKSDKEDGAARAVAKEHKLSVQVFNIQVQFSGV